MSTLSKTVTSPLFLLMVVVGVLGIIVALVGGKRISETDYLSTQHAYTKEELMQVNENIARYALQCIESLKDSGYPPGRITGKCEESARNIYLED